MKDRCRPNCSDSHNLIFSDVWTLRQAVGVLGMLLPVLLLLGLGWVECYKVPLSSISHYYYTRVGSFFVIIVGALAIFLIAYRYEKPIDFWISTVAGVSALLLLLFPTSNLCGLVNDDGRIYSVTNLPVSPFREGFHYVCAAIFLSSLAYMVLFLFTMTDPLPAKMTEGKITRNKIYRVCGVLMVLAMLVIGFDFLAAKFDILPLFRGWYEAKHLTFWMESLAVWSFGVAWFIKGKTLFQD